jgi:hypothetical protein
MQTCHADVLLDCRTYLLLRWNISLLLAPVSVADRMKLSSISNRSSVLNLSNPQALEFLLEFTI